MVEAPGFEPPENRDALNIEQNESPETLDPLENWPVGTFQVHEMAASFP
jgi:hypothetical protein